MSVVREAITDGIFYTRLISATNEIAKTIFDKLLQIIRTEF